MQNDRFAWDEHKNEINIAKHKVTFEEAATVFEDEFAVYIDDEAHSNEYEERFIVIGMSKELKMLMVCHCYRNGDNYIRIISARKADKNDIKLYRR